MATRLTQSLIVTAMTLACSANDGLLPRVRKDAPSAPSPLDRPADSSAALADCAGVVDACPVAGGLTWQCKKRFMSGINYAWHSFGTDFGGSVALGQSGVSANAAIEAELADMKAQGVSVVRWWVFPDLRGDGVQVDASGTPTGLGGSFASDLRAALALAAKHDLYLMLTLFSFDGFRPTSVQNGKTVFSLNAIASDPVKTRMMADKVITPLAELVAADPNKMRVISWDLINEPEWAMTGPSLYGDPDFAPISGLEAVTHTQMQQFLASLTQALHAASPALVTVGAAALKWKAAWSQLNLDYYQFHIYDWINASWPYNAAPTQYGLTKPVVMGEFPLTGLTGASAVTMLQSWLGNGYAGGLAWSVTDPQFNWPTQKGKLATFTSRQPCETTF